MILSSGGQKFEQYELHSSSAESLMEPFKTGTVFSNRYVVFFQILNGMFQTTGWPGVVSAVGKWFGKGRYVSFL